MATAERRGGSRSSLFVSVVIFLILLQARQFQRTHGLSSESLETRLLDHDLFIVGDNSSIDLTTPATTSIQVSITTNDDSSIELTTPATTRIQVPITTRIPSAVHDPTIQYIHRFCPFDTDHKEDEELFGSKRLRYTTDPDKPGAYWVLTSCTKELNMPRLLNESIQRRSRNPWYNATLDSSWKIIIHDVQDWPAPRFLHSQLAEVSAVVGWRRVYLITRSTYRSRSMHRCESQILPRFIGQPFQFTPWIGTVVAGIKHYHFSVRNDVFRALNMELAEQPTSLSSGSFVPNPVTIHRPYDVAHLWDVNNRREAHWRARVSQAVLNMGSNATTTNDTTIIPRNSNLTVLTGIVGWRAIRGRRFVHPEYAQALLRHKIVVVSQRDRYQDHLRLFEALISGAFVLSDPMIDFPVGLVENVTFGVYYGLEDMRQKIMYFLEHTQERLRIAQAGRSVALRRHREWHRWEDLLLGNWTTGRDKYGVTKLNPGS